MNTTRPVSPVSRFLFSVWALVTASVIRAEASSGLVSFSYASAYITEGRDNLESGGLVSSMSLMEQETSAGIGFLVLWYGSAYQVDYNELNLKGGCGFKKSPACRGLPCHPFLIVLHEQPKRI
ncbi:MAG: hypothetical protein WD708_07245 [Kiritimatiellia bacterium]